MEDYYVGITDGLQSILLIRLFFVIDVQCLFFCIHLFSLNRSCCWLSSVFTGSIPMVLYNWLILVHIVNIKYQSVSVIINSCVWYVLMDITVDCLWFIIQSCQLMPLMETHIPICLCKDAQYLALYHLALEIQVLTSPFDLCQIVFLSTDCIHWWILPIVKLLNSASKQFISKIKFWFCSIYSCKTNIYYFL